MIAEDAEQVGRLIAFGLRPRLIAERDSTYRDLVRRFDQDDVFAGLVRAFAAGMGLSVLAVGMPSGIVLVTEAESVFETKMDDYAKYISTKERRETQRMLHGVAHLAIAALAFPRAEDLADDTHRGRVSVEQVDLVVRETCRLLDERAARAEQDDTPLAEDSELERAWRAYQRRPEVGSTKDSRANATATRQIVRRALKYLAERGLVHQVGEDADEVYRATHRYQVQVRETASHAAFRELLELGAIPSLSGTTLASTEG
ncbi:hypothetical protein ACFXPA_36005 [Amycolatopsis sp. NPDC059090]|uniref:hypothetical protein n=1 Tax=unclassified Amycolatopsis TaxID=2618356 RepID=UPI00366EBD5E